jgi:hypothetical protein
MEHSQLPNDFESMFILSTYPGPSSASSPAVLRLGWSSRPTLPNMRQINYQLAGHSVVSTRINVANTLASDLFLCSLEEFDHYLPFVPTDEVIMAAMTALKEDGHLLGLDELNQRGSHPCPVPTPAEHITHYIDPSTETEQRM